MSGGGVGTELIPRDILFFSFINDSFSVLSLACSCKAVAPLLESFGVSRVVYRSYPFLPDA